MNDVYRFFGDAISQTHVDWPKRKVLANTLVLSLIFLFITALSFFTIGFVVAGTMGLLGSVGVLHVWYYFRSTQKLIGSVNLLAFYANIMFFVEVVASGGITSPALYWLMCSPFFALIFSDYEVNKNSAFWIMLTFTEFILLFVWDMKVGELPVMFPMQWKEALVLMYAVTFMCYCSVIILFDVQSRKYQPVLGKYYQSNKSKNIDEGSMEETAGKLHRQLVWIAIVLIPLFPDSLFFEGDEWMTLFAVRIGLVLYYVLVLYANILGKLSAYWLGYVSLGPLTIFLSYATSQVATEHVLVYNINYCAVFIISSLFLLWRWHHSLAILAISFTSYSIFLIAEGRLSVEFLAETGGWLLFSIGFAGVWLTNFRNKYFLKEVQITKELKSSNKKLKIQNSQLKKLNKRLEESESREKQASKIKDKFFSIISHDLRSPIGTVSNFIQILNDETIKLEKEKEKEILERLGESLNSVELLIDNLLNWARSQMGTLKLTFEYFDVQEVSNQCINLFKEDILKKDLTVKINSSGSTTAYADCRTIDFVIRNLLANAIKFSNQGGFVSIDLTEKGDFLSISVIDQGVGMTQVDIDKILDPNVHFTKPGTKNEMGTGLGLQLCVDFIDKNMGKFTIQSRPSHGSTFNFSLSKRRFDAPNLDVDERLFSTMDN